LKEGRKEGRKDGRQEGRQEGRLKQSDFYMFISEEELLWALGG